MGGAKIEQKISFEGVGMSFSRTLNGEYGTTYGFLVLSDDRNGVLNLYTENENIANVRVVDPNDERGYYCEIDLLNEGVTTIIAEKDELTISMEVVVEKPAVIFSREVRGIVGETYGFLMYTDDRNEAPSICVEDSSIADVQIVDPNDQRGYYCEVTGLKDGSTYIIAEKNDKQYKMSVVFTDKGPSRGIDVSRYQLNINWSKVKNNGIEFAFIRAGGRYGASGSIYKDSYFEQNMRGAINAGIDVGVYFFTQAINESEAREEARYVCNLAKNYKVTYPIVIDTEYLSGGRHNNISVLQRTKVVNAFCEEVRRLGYTPMIYANKNWLENNLYMGQLSQYWVWVAQYNTTCTYRGEYKCWQYTSSGKVDGINGKVDMNIWYN